MAHRTKLTEEKMLEIIEEVSHDSNVTRSCSFCGISRTAFYTRLNEEPEKWKPLLDAAVEAGTDALIDEAKRRAFSGVKDAVYHSGNVVGMKTVYSDTLLMFLIKARRPEFRDRLLEIPPDGKFALTINTGGKDDGPGKE